MLHGLRVRCELSLLPPTSLLSVHSLSVESFNASPSRHLGGGCGAESSSSGGSPPVLTPKALTPANSGGIAQGMAQNRLQQLDFQLEMLKRNHKKFTDKLQELISLSMLGLSTTSARMISALNDALNDYILGVQRIRKCHIAEVGNAGHGPTSSKSNTVQTEVLDAVVELTLAFRSLVQGLIELVPVSMDVPPPPCRRIPYPS